MKTEQLTLSSPKKIHEFTGPGEGSDQIKSDTIDGLPLEALVISSSSMCSFMGAKSPWSNS